MVNHDLLNTYNYTIKNTGIKKIQFIFNNRILKKMKQIKL